MATDVLGAPIKRVEDPALHHRQGPLPRRHQAAGMAHMAILRSPYAHANIRSIDTSAAKAMPGVIAVFVGADIPYNPLPMAWPAGGSAGIQNNVNTPRVLATDSVKWTGEGVAAVDRRDARAGGRRARGDRGRLRAAADRRRRREGDPARRAAAPRERPEQRRLRLDGRRQGRHGRRDRRRRGRRPAADRQPAPHPEPDGGPRRHRLVQPGHRRVHGLDVEPDAAHPAAAADRVRDRHPGAQGPLHRPDVGGAFGTKIFCYADMALVMFASKAIGGRPVKWVESRRENYQSHDPRPRPHHLPRDRRQARRRGHRAAGQDVRQPRRPPVDDRPGHPDDALRPRPGRAATRSRTSTARSPASTRTRRSSTPTAAPAGPRRRTSSSGRWTSSPTRSGWTRRRSAARTSSRPTRSRTTTRRASGRPSSGAKIYIDSGNYEPALDKALTMAGYDELDAKQGRGAASAASSSASASPPTSRSAASRRRSGSAPSARAGAPRCGSRPTSRST